MYDRFELFGFPLSHAYKGKEIMHGHLEHYLGFISYPLSPDSEHYASIHQMKGAIRDACEIYRRRAECTLGEQESVSLLRSLRQKVMYLSHEVEGSHALVWTYFVAAAESTLPEDRDFFTQRLTALYGRTRFRSITVGLEALRKLRLKNEQWRWPEVLANEMPVLVM